MDEEIWSPPVRACSHVDSCMHARLAKGAFSNSALCVSSLRLQPFNLPWYRQNSGGTKRITCKHNIYLQNSARAVGVF
jgi:hypothetical protein